MGTDKIIVFGIAAAVLCGPSSASTASVERGVIGSADVRIRLEPGESYLISLPATAYPGAPFTVTVSDVGYISQTTTDSWIMKVTLSSSSGVVSWNGVSNAGGNSAGTVAAGGSALIAQICVRGFACLGTLSVVPLGSGAGLQLSAGSNRGIGRQTFVISTQDG